MAAATPWHALDPSDYGALPRAVAVASAPRVDDRERFWHMAPLEQRGTRPARHYEALPPQPRFLDDAGGASVAGSAEGSLADPSDASEAPEGRPGEAPSREAPRRRRAAPPAVPEDDRWYKMAPQHAPEGYVKPPTPEPGPVTLLEEDGHWYRMKPRQIPDDAPRVRAVSPQLLALAQGPRDHRGRLIEPGAATPWPEQGAKWHTMDRHQVYRQQQAWELPAERGTYDEWEACRVEDCVMPKYYDKVDRWYEMPPVDDGAKGAREPEQFDEFIRKDPEAAAALAEAKAVALLPKQPYAPYEDSSRWYKIPGHGTVEPPPRWREC